MTDKPKIPPKPKKIIGRAENITFLDNADVAVPARIDTGAKTSSVWASNIVEKDGVLSFCLFAKENPHFNGEVHATRHFWKRAVANSTGLVQDRYVVRLRVKLRGKKIIARFSLADRSSQVYPVLVGRNVLRGKFIVDVASGSPDISAEVSRSKALQAHLKSS